MTLRVIDMFAGIGGFSLGLHRAGLAETVAVAELDPYASRVLAKRFPNAPNVGDVTTAEYPDADIICAGFPCQDISFAGLGAGLAGTRSGLWREVVRAIRLVRPRYTLLENVAALLGRGLDTVLGDLAEVGHDAEWHCIPAGSIGAPHIRDRIWIFTQPQHPDADRLGSHREGVNVNGDAEPAHKQICLSGSLGQILADANGAGLDGRAEAGDTGGERTRVHELAERRPDSLGRYWATEPDVGRVAHGIPHRAHRLRCLGNAVVPQVVEAIGRAILASLAEQREAA